MLRHVQAIVASTPCAAGGCCTATAAPGSLTLAHLLACHALGYGTTLCLKAARLSLSWLIVQAVAGTFVDGLRAALNTPLSLEHTPAEADATVTAGATSTQSLILILRGVQTGPHHTNDTVDCA